MAYKMGFALCMRFNLGIIFFNIPPALTQLMGLYEVSCTQISLLISALLWSHALMQVPAGMITDRLGLYRSLLSCLIFMAMGGLVCIGQFRGLLSNRVPGDEP
ncbi:MAG: hypothetical protein JSW39_14725 [Desulfobacterales bacterium]|nr:MAG: hypothetical protein JSW39_14725 [Desulfobacterales bacterium]